MATRYNYSLL